MKAVLEELIRKPNLAVLGLLLGIAITSIAVTYSAHLNRVLFNELQYEMNYKNSAQVEWGQLLLQHSTLTIPSRIERLATNKLGMKIPKPMDIVMVVQ